MEIFRAFIWGIIFLPFITLAAETGYPPEWWAEVPEEQKKSWEILPQEAGPGEVILSKRTELGVFSNFGDTPFRFEGKRYASVEAFWQMMKYPDSADPSDPRHKFEGWPLTRDEVRKLSGHTAKKAGDKANEIMRQHNINWVSYNKKRFDYKDHDLGSRYHYHLVSQAIEAKIAQNQELYELLLKTKGLVLKPDHHVKPSKPPAYHYYAVLMQIRDR